MIIQHLRETPNPFSEARVVGTNVSNDTYLRQDPEAKRGTLEFVMNRSELMLFASCPSRWYRGYTPKETDATDWGSRLDCLITSGRAEFDRLYVVHPATVTATKTMQCVKDGEVLAGALIPWRHCAEAAEWKARAGDREILSPEDFEQIEQACRRLDEDPLLRDFIACSTHQVMVIASYKDKATGITVPWKSLIDFVPSSEDDRFRNFLGDLKSCRSADPRGWERVCDDRNYDAQAAANLDAYRAATGEPRDTFAHILVENLFPFEPSGAILSADLVEFGRLKIIGALRWYCECLQRNHWPTWREFSKFALELGNDRWIKIDASPYHSQLKPE